MAVSQDGASDSFTREEVARLRELLRGSGREVDCPHCGAQPVWISHPLVGGTMGAYWEIGCDACGRSVIIGDLPAGRRPSK